MLDSVLHIVSAELDQLVLTSSIKKAIEPQYEEYFHWKFDSFKYDENGPQPNNGHSVQFVKANWFRSFQYFRQILPTEDYFISLEKKIAEIYPLVLEPQSAAMQICNWFINVYLTQPTGEWSASIADIKLRVQRDLSMGPLNCNMSIALTGITIESDCIELSETLTIRQCRQADLEKPVLVNNRVSGITRPFANYPRAYLDYHFIATVQQFNPTALALLVDKFIATLRLCGIGSVEYFGYAITTDALIFPPMTGEINNGNARDRHNRYYISKELEDSFRKTFRTIENKIT